MCRCPPCVTLTWAAATRSGTRQGIRITGALIFGHGAESGCPSPRTDGHRPDDDGELRRALAVALLPGIDELTRRVVDDIHAHSGTYASGSPVSRDDLWGICRDNLVRALEDFGGLPSSEGDGEHAARETGRRRAEQDVPLDTVLQAYRRGGRVMWQMMAEHLRATRGTPDAVGPVSGDRDTELDMAGAVWETIDRYSLVMAESYRLTQLEMQGRQDTRRVALFEALLDGRGDDPAVAAAASAALGVPVHDRYVIVVAAQDPAAPPNPAPVLDDHGIWSFWRPRSGRYAGIVRLAAGSPVSCSTCCGTTPVPPRACHRSSTGSPRRAGPCGWPSRRCARCPPGAARRRPSTTGSRRCSSSAKPEIAERIVTTQLGGVLDTAAERDVLLGTLRVWLDHGCSAARAAELLYCHRNTVLNRIGRIAELTGRSAESGEVRLGWALALRALPLMGADDERAPMDGDLGRA